MIFIAIETSPENIVMNKNLILNFTVPKLLLIIRNYDANMFVIELKITENTDL